MLASVGEDRADMLLEKPESSGSGAGLRALVGDICSEIAAWAYRRFARAGSAVAKRASRMASNPEYLARPSHPPPEMTEQGDPA